MPAEPPLWAEALEIEFQDEGHLPDMTAVSIAAKTQRLEFWVIRKLTELGAAVDGPTCVHLLDEPSARKEAQRKTREGDAGIWTTFFPNLIEHLDTWIGLELTPSPTHEGHFVSIFGHYWTKHITGILILGGYGIDRTVFVSALTWVVLLWGPPNEFLEEVDEFLGEQVVILKTFCHVCSLKK